MASAASRDDEFLNAILFARDNKRNYTVTRSAVDDSKPFLLKLASIDLSIIDKVWSDAKNREHKGIREELHERYPKQISDPIMFLFALDCVTRRDLCHYLGEMKYQPNSGTHNNVYEFIKWISNNFSDYFVLEHLNPEDDKAINAKHCKMFNTKGTIEYYFGLDASEQGMLITAYNEKMKES